MAKVITDKRNEEHDSKQTIHINTENMCLDVYKSSCNDEAKQWYIVYDEFSMENYRLQVGAVKLMIDCGCPEKDAISLLVMARKTIGTKNHNINNYQTANIFRELIEDQGYSPEKILRVISNLGEADAVALYRHKMLPSGFDRYFMVDGWESNGVLESLFLEQEEQNETYN